MAKKFYVVWAGRETGIFTDWASCKRSIDKFAGAKYKSFPNKEEAEAAFVSGALTVTKKPAKSSIKKSSKHEVAFGVEDFDVVIYCDGGCEPNPGKSGSGSAVYKKGELSSLWYGLYNPNGTNNTAELNALHQSLIMAELASSKGASVGVLCDSMYAINCVSNWAYGWKAKGWKKATGEIKNLAMIKDIHTLYDSIKDNITLSHVKAHAGTEGNELADRMTMLAVDRKVLDYVRYEDDIDLQALLKMRAG